jgi:hypothetical protein
MASARLDKLKSLLKRVEDRRAKPRLHAVAAPRPAAAPAAALADLEELSTTTQRVAAPSIAPEPLRPAAAPEPARPTAKGPLDDALDDFGTDAPLEVRALAEPITAPRPEPRPLLIDPPRELPEPAVTYRPEPISLPARPSMPTPGMLAPVVPLQVAGASTNVTSKDTLEFGIPRIELPVPKGELSGPTQTVEPAPLAAAAPPARAVSAARVEVARSFGELLELSLSLRPR